MIIINQLLNIFELNKCTNVQSLQRCTFDQEIIYQLVRTQVICIFNDYNQ